MTVDYYLIIIAQVINDAEGCINYMFVNKYDPKQNILQLLNYIAP